MNKFGENSVLEEFLTLLKLEKIDENRFIGQSQDMGYRRVFGGQVLGQALCAAYRTVPSGRRVHSLHAYFQKIGDATKPIVYEIDRTQDGKKFSRRRIVAIQKGCAIFNMSASFQIDELGFDHHDKAPKVVGPEGLENELELAEKVKHRIPSAIRDRVLYKKAIEMRPVNPINPISPDKREPKRYIWLKAIGKMPDDFMVHQHLLAWASDFNLGLTSLYPHGHSFWEPDIQVASLDHSIWFHRDFRMDEWLLYVMESPNACKGRGLNYGKIYTREGILVASVTQETLIRYYALK